VNSRLDDVFPSMVGDSVYITSNRREGTDMDVYVSIRPLAAAPPDAERPIDRSAPGSTLLTGTVIDESTQSPVADIEVNATRSDTREVVASTRTDTVGRYRLQVPTETPITISAQSDTLFFASYDTTFPASASERSVELPTALSLPSVFILRVNFPTSVFDAPYDMTLDSNGRETSQPWRSAIDLLATNVRASGARLRRLILTGHTDDVDTETANLELGRQRVDFVIDQLLQRGVPRGVLEGRSAGERELPARRPDESAEQWRKRARRVELVKVLQE
jgi:outer membrane protein OmpA-like peptidoglycan-associated protein